MKYHSFSTARWQSLPALAKYLVLALAVLVVVSLVFPFIALAQSSSDQDLRGSLYFFSMKPVVVGEGSQTIHVSSKRWNMDSSVTIDASSECSNTYGMSFDTTLPATIQITEQYDGSNNGRTHFPLTVTPGSVASGINESNSSCVISISDGAYTIERPLRQILAADKEAMALLMEPSLAPGTNKISWEDQGHPPGVWFLDANQIHAATWWSLSIPKYLEVHGWTHIPGKYSDFAWAEINSRSSDHPGEASIVGIPQEWIDNGYYFCMYANFSAAFGPGKGTQNYNASPEKCYNVGSIVPVPTPTPAPTKVPTPTPLPAPTQVIGNEWEDKHCNKVKGMLVQPARTRTIDANGNYAYSYGLRYECSTERYNVVKNGTNQWVWDDPALPAEVNGQVYVVDDSIVNPAPGKNPFELSPNPRSSALLDNGTARQFTILADEPITIVANPADRPHSANANEHGPVDSRLAISATEPYDNPCKENLRSHRLDFEPGQTVWISGCSAGPGYFDILRQSTGEGVNYYKISVVTTREPFAGKERVLPDAPRLESFSATSHSMTIGWLPPANIGDDQVSQYEVQYRESGSSDWITHIADIKRRPSVSSDLRFDVVPGNLSIAVEDVAGIEAGDTIVISERVSVGFTVNLSGDHPAGETRFALFEYGADPVHTFNKYGFRNGDTVVFDDGGPNEETLVIAGASPTQITTTTPSVNAHAIRTAVARFGVEVTEELTVRSVDTDKNYIWTWSAAKNAYSAAGNSNVSRFSVYDEGDRKLLRRSATISGLNSDQSYEYRVRAYNKTPSPGPWATSLGSSINNPEIRNAPTGPITIKEHALVGSFVHQVTVVNHLGSDHLVQLSIGGDDAHAFVITSNGAIHTNVAFDYDVQSTYNFSINTYLPGTPNPVSTSAPVVVHIQDELGLPDPAGTPTLVSSTETSVTIQWEAPDTTGRLPVVGYEVRYSPKPGIWINHPHSGTSTTATITGLTSGQRYHVQVRATSSEGVIQWSGVLEVRPGAPSGLGTNDAPNTDQAHGGFNTSSATPPYLVFNENDGLTAEEREILQQLLGVLYAGFQH